MFPAIIRARRCWQFFHDDGERRRGRRRREWSGDEPPHGVTTTVQTTQAALTWDLDVWGGVFSQIESNVAGAQVSAADLTNAKLTAQAQLALAYFNLRAAYSLRSLLEKGGI